MTDPFNPDQPDVPDYEPGRGDPEPSYEPEMLPDATPVEMPEPGSLSGPGSSGPT